MATADQRKELAAALGPEFMVFERTSAQMGIGYSDLDVMYSSRGIELSELVPNLDPSGPDFMPKMHEAAERLKSQADEQLRERRA